MIDLRGSVPRGVVLPISLVTVLFLGATDYLTGYELSFSIFYLLPISFATLAGGRIEGFMSATASAVAWLVADLLSGNQYSQALIPYWNSVVRVGYFCLHTVLLSSLQRAIAKEEELSGKDALTGAPNWRHLEERAQQELERARRSRRPMTFCYFDLDNFKAINDTHGHETGDDLLCVVAETARAHLRPTDVLARMGGDEFAILLPETGYEQAHAVLSRVSGEILSEMERCQWPVTVSFGAVTYNLVPASVGAMVKRADDLMYSVKKSGKNDLAHVQWPAPPAA